MAQIDRAEALARLAALGVTNDLTEATPEPALELSGDEVYAGGEEVRILVKPAHLVYRDEDKDLVHATAVVGDTVLLSKSEAKRLDGLGATMTKSAATKASKAKAEPVTVPAVPEGSDSTAQPTGTTPPGTAASTSSKTDEELGAMKAEELVAHVNQFEGDKVRVRALEGKRSQPRSTVLKATAPDGDDPDEELD